MPNDPHCVEDGDVRGIDRRPQFHAPFASSSFFCVAAKKISLSSILKRFFFPPLIGCCYDAHVRSAEEVSKSCNFPLSPPKNRHGFKSFLMYRYARGDDINVTFLIVHVASKNCQRKKMEFDFFIRLLLFFLS